MEQPGWQPYLEQAVALHGQCMVIDGHCDSILEVHAGKRRLGEHSDIGHLDLPRARAAGLGGQVFAVWPELEKLHGAPARHTLALLDRLHGEFAANAGRVQVVYAAADLDRARAAGRLAAIIGVEGGEALEGDLALLRMYYRLGVRVLGLVWNYRNALADGADEWETGGGLTRFGRAVVQEMNRLGMVVDCAHLAPAGLADVLELSAHPVLFSHGNCRALFDHRRNLADDQIRALAARGGVFGISLVNLFMAPPGGPRCTLAQVADQVEHVCHVVGSAAHVALGTDFDGTLTLPEGLESVLALPRLTAELLRRGWAEADLVQFLGGNYLRVFRAVLGEEATP